MGGAQPCTEVWEWTTSKPRRPKGGKKQARRRRWAAKYVPRRYARRHPYQVRYYLYQVRYYPYHVRYYPYHVRYYPYHVRY